MLKRLIINGLCILFKYISFLEHEVIPIAFSNRYRMTESDGAGFFIRLPHCP